MKAQIGLTLFLSLFFLVGIAVLYSGLRAFYRGRQAAAWPTADGRILESRIEEHSDSDSTTWQVKVRYAYSIGRDSFESDRIAFGYNGSSNRKEHQALSDKLQTGSRVKVYFDPRQPDTSVLATGVNRSTLVMIIFAVTWLLFVTGFGFIMLTASGRDNGMLNKIQTAN